MSEVQNRAVRMLQQQSPELTIANSRFQMLRAALALYRASGGLEQVARDLCADTYQTDGKDVGRTVGDVMIALAAIGHLNDIDMMQAAYNQFETGSTTIPEFKQQFG